MPSQSFKTLIVWQKSSEFAVHIYKAFSGLRDYSFRDQIQRSSISISNNIAEGYARHSDKAFRNFLMIAKGSATETESMLEVAKRLRYLTDERAESLLAQLSEIHRLINGFLKTLKY